ncbi:hypothetical protein [Streptomyces sp. NPDC057494]|uniref:hypothetical protein n=1 Tax=Streptomyces sp. NPDC057494 TaxID=3346148 RepID=UPI003677E0F3
MTDRHLSTAGRPCPAGRTDDIEQFLVHYGDTIDDRVAEIVAEIVEEVLGEQLRRSRRDVVLPVTVALLAAAAVSLALMWSPWAVPLVWAATSVICVSLSQTARIPRRS